MSAKKNVKRKVLMPEGQGRIPEDAIRRAIAELKAEREAKARRSRSKAHR
jgi:hypothetical protein